MTANKTLRIRYDEVSFMIGYQAGLDGKRATSKIPPEVTDSLAYYSGLIEGLADRHIAPEKRKPQTHPKHATPEAGTDPR